MPIFGRDGDGVAWRPSAEVAEATRLAGFLRATGEPSLDALQARAVADPGWFWGAAADDIGIAWHRRPTQVLDLARRTGLGALVARRRLRLRPRGDRAARRARPGRRGARLGGRGRRRPAADERGARSGGRGRSETLARPRRPAGRPRRDLPADARRDGGRGARARPAAGDLHADLLRATARRRWRPGSPTARRRCSITADGFLRRGSWVPLKGVADEAVAAVAVRPARARRAARAATPSRRRGRPAATPGGTTRSAARRTRPSAARSTPRRRTC